jgi:hypothetical protein
MLNDFSDRGPTRKPKAFILSGEFWLGVATVLIGSMLVLGFLI